MKSYRSLFFTLTLIVLSQTCFADVYKVGKQKLNIPVPQGYIRVVPEMEGYYDLWTQMTPPGSEFNEIALFIESKYRQIALKGEVEPLDRFIVIRTLRTIQRMEFSSKDFKSARKELKSEIRESYKEICSNIKDKTGKSENEINWQTDIQHAYEFTDIVNLPPFHEDGDSISFLSYDDSEPSVVTMLNPAGKIIHVVCFGGNDDISLTKITAASFSKSILASNPPAPRKSSESVSGTHVSGRSIRGLLKLGILVIVFLGFIAKKLFGRLLNR